MLQHATHTGGVAFKSEIQFRTRFDYMFPIHARTADCLLPPEVATLEALLMLGTAMADPGVTAMGDPLDSNIPAGFTYLGQFIDHDTTARTDRELFESRIAELDGTPRVSKPVDPDQVIVGLANGRRPHLDLDSVYGDGPGLIPEVETTATPLYESDLKLKITPIGSKFDLLRNDQTGVAIIADMRNDENLNVSQLHAAVIAFNNAVSDSLPAALSDQARYSRARQLTRWCYQAVVLDDYLKRVCDPAVVADIVINGPRFFAPLVDGQPLFMPLEFSVAAFRFGHSMIRPSYRLNTSNPNVPVMELLDTKHRTTPTPPRQLPASDLIDWDNFVGSGAQKARRIDPKLAAGLFALPFGPNVLANLAQRNLLRGYILSIPTGQSVAYAMGVKPLSGDKLVEGESPELKAAFEKGCFHERTPLWYYVLKEAQKHNAGQHLGAVGSRIVAETLVGLIMHDRNSVLHAHDDAVTLQDDGVVVVRVPVGATGTDITQLADMLEVAGVL
jgi:hypothetical protein